MLPEDVRVDLDTARGSAQLQTNEAQPPALGAPERLSAIVDRVAFGASVGPLQNSHSQKSGSLHGVAQEDEQQLRMFDRQWDLPTVESRASQIEKSAHAFVTANPEVWSVFVRECFRWIARGHKRWSSKAAVERVRYCISFDSGEEFKINNNYTAVFARWFIATWPECEGFFELRERKTEKQVAA